MPEDWTEAFPGLEGIEPEARSALLAGARLVTLPPGSAAFRSGGACNNYLLVLSGSVRVQMVSETGREIVLYRVEDGESCILTTSCLLAREDYPAEAVSETEVKAAILPAASFQVLLARSPVFREFVFSTFGRRISDLLMLIEEIAFRRVDVRLSRFLLERMDRSGVLECTHQELAVELGSAREVISRQLKEFERRAWVSLHRGRVRVLNAGALRAHAERDAV